MEDILYWVILYLLIGFAVGAGVCCEEHRVNNPCSTGVLGTPWLDPKLLVLAGAMWPLVALALLFGLTLGRSHSRHRKDPPTPVA